MIRSTTALAIGLLASPVWATGLDELATAPALDDLLEAIEPAAPAPDGRVTVDAWVQPRDDGRELVVVVQPEGKTKLVADPGITLTPAEDAFGVTWQVPVPHRVVDPKADYWEGERAVRLPFTAAEGTPLEVRVEYAWCVLDYQCFFGEEQLSVSNRVE
jgi:hypothetical protein